MCELRGQKTQGIIKKTKAGWYKFSKSLISWPCFSTGIPPTLGTVMGGDTELLCWFYGTWRFLLYLENILAVRSFRFTVSVKVERHKDPTQNKESGPWSILNDQ